MPSVSPLATDMLTCCTALTMPRLVANSTVRSLTSSNGCAVICVSPRAMTVSLAPFLRGEGRGERLSAYAGERGVRGEPHSPGFAQSREPDLSPQAARGAEDRG